MLAKYSVYATDLVPALTLDGGRQRRRHAVQAVDRAGRSGRRPDEGGNAERHYADECDEHSGSTSNGHTLLVVHVQWNRRQAVARYGVPVTQP